MTWGFVRFRSGRESGHKCGCAPFRSGSQAWSQAWLCAVRVGVAGEDPSDIEGAPSPIASPLRSRRDRAPSPASYGFLPRSPPGSRRLFSESDNTTGTPRPPNRYTATSPKQLVTWEDTVRIALVNRTTETEGDGKLLARQLELGFAGGAAYRVGNVGNRLERLGIFLHGSRDLFIGVHDRRVVPTPESGSDLGK